MAFVINIVIRVYQGFEIFGANRSNWLIMGVVFIRVIRVIRVIKVVRVVWVVWRQAATTECNIYIYIYMR